jgi:hypothetical protein
MLNVPIAFGTPRTEYLQQLNRGSEWLTGKIRPQLILISAGFDPHRADPVGSLGLESEDVGSMTRSVLEIANLYSGGRVVSVRGRLQSNRGCRIGGVSRATTAGHGMTQSALAKISVMVLIAEAPAATLATFYVV